VQASGRSGYSDPEIYNHVMLSRMFQMEADWEASEREMGKARALAIAIPPAMVREHLVSQQVRVDLAFRRVGAAQALLQAEGFRFDLAFEHPPLPVGSPVTDPLGLLYNSALRILLYLGRNQHDRASLERGLALATRVLEGELQCRHIPVALETLLLRSQLHAASGHAREGLADVAHAVELAEPEGFISIFLEEGPPIAEALTNLHKHNLLAKGSTPYLQQMIGVLRTTRPSREAQGRHPFSGDPCATPIESLTPREMQVLQRIAAGDSNQSIALQLVITLSAVKKHSGNIFHKLNVNSRTQAVSRARQLGLLSPDL
jgi:DNA-binding CsgD family transcriptional regulator